MDPQLRQKFEMEALADICDELNYYQLLKVERGCEQALIDEAYRAEARRLHPDRFNSNPDKNVKAWANKVYRLFQEAWNTLKDPETRAAYDDQLEEGARRLSIEKRRAAAAEAAAAANPEHAAKTEKGGKYWKMALQNWHDKEYQGCVMQIQFALNFEPDNETMIEWKEKAEKKAAEATEEQAGNAYKLRIV